MYEPLHPLDEQIMKWPGIDLLIDGTSVRVRISSWLDQTCIAALELMFEHSIAGLYVYDETTNFAGQVAMPEADSFAGGSHWAHPLWLDRSGSRLALYGAYGAMNYKYISSYCFVGQSIVVVLDIADKEPEIKRLDPVEMMA
jgi:hypothetical protein